MSVNKTYGIDTEEVLETQGKSTTHHDNREDFSFWEGTSCGRQEDTMTRLNVSLPRKSPDNIEGYKYTTIQY